MSILTHLDIREKKGAVVVELAVVFLLLMALLFGVIEIGFLWMQSHYINNAAREGARAAAKLKVDEDPAPVVENAVREMLKGVYGDARVDDPGNCCSDGNFIAVDISNATVDGLRAYEVTVEVQTAEIWEPVLWGILNIFPGADFDDVEALTASALFVRQDQSAP